MALAQSTTRSSFLCGGCRGLDQPARGQRSLIKPSGTVHSPTVTCLGTPDSRGSQYRATEEVSASRRDDGAVRFTPRASPVLEELRLLSDAAAEAEVDRKGDWLYGLKKMLSGKQSIKQARKTVTGLEEPMKELFDYVNEHSPLEDRSRSSTLHGKEVYRKREEAPCGEYLFDLEPQAEEASHRGNGKLRRDPNILPSQWEQELKQSTPPGSPAKLGGGLKDSLSKEQMLALAGASMVGESDPSPVAKAGHRNGVGEKRNVVQQVTSTLEHWAENVRK